MRKRWLAVLAAFLWTGCPSATATDGRPNVVVVLADDLGFSDLGCYGGEIETPNLDRLAAGGLRFTQFYNCAKCETTRATLLTGRYHHEVGIAKLAHAATLAEVAQQAGYTTLMAGKWHMEGNPLDRGFERYFGHLSGACNYFTGDGTFRIDREVYEVPESGFYTTDANTDWAVRFLHEAPTDKPFFLYLAYNAPHYPLQAPESDVRKYLGRYRGGWDAMRSARAARQQAMGLLPHDFTPAPRPPDVPAWDSLSLAEQIEQDLMMATYAAMVDRLDRNIGRLMAALEATGRADNTLLLFFSDNGACPFQRTRPETREQLLLPWDPTSYWTYDKGWAHACNTPFREYKRNQHEGGIATPCIAHWPAGPGRPVIGPDFRESAEGRLTDQPAHLVDIMATLLDLAGTAYPTTIHDQPTGSPRGLSLRPILEGRVREPHPTFHFTYYGNHNALREGDWKLVNLGNGPWELYDLATDRTEQHDLAETHVERRDAMAASWQQLAEEIHVPDPRSRRNGGGQRNEAKADAVRDE
ncbi:MAG: arylsulfatase [Verrucomicrobiales bacterium]|nr:arylsulfatase [Verrucomicrobiales bacterium]